MNKSHPNSAQNSIEQPQTTPVAVNFSHRLSHNTANIANSLALVDTINSMVNRASAVLLMLSAQYTDECQPLENDTNYSLLETVSHELSDIKAVMNAHHAVLKNGGV